MSGPVNMKPDLLAHFNQVEKNVNLAPSEKLMRFLHDNQTTSKVILIASLIIGAAAIALLPLTLPLVGGIAIAMAVVGGVIAIISAIALKALCLLFSTTHTMSTHVFTERTIGTHGLKYHGDVPVLTLDMSNPESAGCAQGQILGKEIQILRDKWNDFLVKAASPLVDPSKLPTFINQLKERIQTLDPEYMNELKGLADGTNDWIDSQTWKLGKPSPLTVDELLMLHLMSDSVHTPNFAEFEKGAKLNQENQKQNNERLSQQLANAASEFANVGCTVVIDGDKNGLTFARNMDWPALGIMGTYSIVVHRKYPEGSPSHDTVELSFPGLVGTLTGMNKKGLCLAMNVCGGDGNHHRDGVPTLLYNRWILQNNQCVQDVVALARYRQWDEIKPLGAYHMSIADSTTAAAGIHMYQGEFSKALNDNSHLIRPFNVNEEDRKLSEADEKNAQARKPLIVTNSRYKGNPDGSAGIPATPFRHHSKERQDVIEKLFSAAEVERGDAPNTYNRGDIAAAAIQLPYVNNWETTHTVNMNVGPNGLEMYVGVNNAFAADQPLHKVPVAELFEQ